MSNPLGTRTIAAVKLMTLLANALLPQQCFICGGGNADSLLCPGCLDDLPPLSLERCPVCAVPTPGSATCGACLTHPPHFDATLAAFAYGFPMSPLVTSLKYRARLQLAAFLARLVSQAIDRPAVDCIMPMPLHPARLASRGFNQSMEIGRWLARHWQLPVHARLCVRDRDTAPQAELDWTDRRDNVKGAFRCEQDVTGQHILVVDDVMTTGATLDELARALKSRGAVHVTNCVIARALPRIGSAHV